MLDGIHPCPEQNGQGHNFRTKTCLSGTFRQHPLAKKVIGPDNRRSYGAPPTILSKLHGVLPNVIVGW